MLNIQEAQKELSQKNFNQIQTETAWKWASRAAASFQNCLSEQGSKKLACFVIGEEYLHEAVEHAALVEGDDITSQVKQQILPYQDAAAKDLDKLLGGSNEQNPGT